MANLPWLVPVFLVSVGVALASARVVARVLRTSRLVASALVASVGLIVAATLTPLRGAVESGRIGTGVCDLSRFTPLSPSELLVLGDPTLNVILFVPLGISIAYLPSTRRSAIVLASAIVLPFAIEWTQLVATALARACESADVVDNLTGLVVGLVVGLVLRRVVTPPAA